MVRPEILARGLLLFAALTWASNVVVGRWLRVDIDPDILNLLRWSLASLILLPFTVRQIWRHRDRFLLLWRLYLVCAVVGLALFQIVLYTALQWTAAANVGVALALSPIVALIAGQRARGRALARRSWLGFGVSFTGVLLVLFDGAGARIEVGGENLLGAGLAVFGAALWGVYSVLSARLPRDVPPFASLSVLCAVAALISLIPVLVHVQATGSPEVSPAGFAGALYLALVATIAGLAAYNRGIAGIGAAAGAQFVHFTPIFTVILAALVLGEAVTVRDAVGFGLIAAGLTISFRSAARLAGSRP